MARNRKFNFQIHSGEFLLLLICADILFIILHGFHKFSGYIQIFSIFKKSAFSLDADFGVAESFQYVKELWIIVLMTRAFIRRFEPFYLSWALLFGCMLLDDMLLIHERFGETVTHYFGYEPALHLRAQDFGELTIYAVFGFLILAVIAVSYFRSPIERRRICKNLALMIAALALFGVIFDMVQVMVDHHRIWRNVFIVVEDGGEMLIMSLICWYVFTLVHRRNNLDSPKKHRPL
jgi:hypothetical protein